MIVNENSLRTISSKYKGYSSATEPNSVFKQIIVDLIKRISSDRRKNRDVEMFWKFFYFLNFLLGEYLRKELNLILFPNKYFSTLFLLAIEPHFFYMTLSVLPGSHASNRLSSMGQQWRNKNEKKIVTILQRVVQAEALPLWRLHDFGLLSVVLWMCGRKLQEGRVLIE